MKKIKVSKWEESITLVKVDPCPHDANEEVSMLLITGGRYVIRCDKCGAQGPPAENEEKAAEKWNLRIETEGVK